MSPLNRFFWMLALTLCWSPSYLFIMLALEDIPPFSVVSLRVTISALIFYGILKFRKHMLPVNMRFWGHATVMAVLSCAVPYSLFCFAEQTIDSALAAILTGVSPMCTAIVAHLVLPSDRLTVSKVTGISFCFLGFLLLLAPNLMEGVSGSVFGMLCATCAAFSYGFSHVYAKKFITGLAPFVVPTAQMIMASIMLCPLALWVDVPFSLPMPSLSAWMGLFGLVFFCTVSAFTIYYRLLETSGATAVSLVACFFPVGGMILGFLFLDETFTSLALFASGIILVGMMLVNGVIRIGEPRVRIQESVSTE